MPLKFKGSIGRLFSFSNGYNKNKKWSLFGVDSRDYLRRGNETMEEKMKAFLTENDMNINDYPTVYLITAPRFLGYQFNPVSFWYLKDKDGVLSLVILEVNNTFDERHMYLCRPSNSSLTGFNISFGQTFSQNFSKEFHVSPFNDRAGKYNVLTRDPLSEKEDSNGIVNTTITLYDDFDNKKLIAGLRSVVPPIFLSELSTSVISSTIFVIKYGWSGLITFPRIVWEAAKLFGVKRLKVYLRPEVRRKTISRNATALEIELEKYFRLYLRTRVEKHPVSTIIHYNSAGIGNLPHKETFKSAEAAAMGHEITFTVLSPRFYTVWAANWSIQEVLSAEELKPEHKKIVEISDVVRIINLLDRTPLAPWNRKYHGRALTWPLIKIMRGQKTPTFDQLLTKDLQILNAPKVDPIGYSRCVLQAVLTMRICYGDEVWLGAYDLAIRGVLVYFAWSGFTEAGSFALKLWGAIGGLMVWRIMKDFM
ncbi:DUF1365-domain-containing protein [Morchella conica CCBAS932]|uniref:DUF1365-domain-containing protein n=1 Tax=Morchella conica CCBAS932 TaxID=1392247 RepID=A0A3N4KFZ0_9PEZI|nr:DUF1365-domain-containing protein [Morchella conica CCBAS932]